MKIYFTFFLPDFALCIQLPCKPLPKASLEEQYVIWPPVTLYSIAHEFPQDEVSKIRFCFHHQDTRIILDIVCPPLRCLILLPQRTAISLACLLLWLNNVHQSTFWASICSSGTVFFSLQLIDLTLLVILFLPTSVVSHPSSSQLHILLPHSTSLSSHGPSLHELNSFYLFRCC